MSQRNLRYSIAVSVPRGAVDGAGYIADQDASPPARIFEPDQLIHSTGKRYQIRFAVVVDVRGDELITAPQIGADCMLRKSRRRRVRSEERQFYIQLIRTLV